jgi:hypothetical protein
LKIERLNIKEMKYIILFIFIFVIIPTGKSVFAQEDSTRMVVDSTVTDEEIKTPDIPKPVLNETNSFILNKWEISEYRENGKLQELPNYEIEFFEDGTYAAIEEEEFDNGVWNLGGNNTQLIFDDNSPNREVWNIVSMDAKKIVVKFTDEGKTYEYTFIPWVKRQQ